ncbi:hypothetical protein [Streptomyces sp. NRRL F-5650]|uniref:hypothetical protein n=1 Tax=Streptomyces sp. NRRL F-5650 TaxID=1463868 RepID=UPI0004C71EEC|nr:hypothetical protein [Streptomyces sp. NRRL F-5650]
MISPLVMTAKKVIEAAWLNGPTYDMAVQAAEALESAQLLQSPETAAELARLRADQAANDREYEAATSRIAELEQQTKPQELRDVTKPDFYQPGHTYGTSGLSDWKFRVDHITTRPDDGERTALGWRHFQGVWEPYAYGEDDYDIHQLSDHGLTDECTAYARTQEKSSRPAADATPESAREQRLAQLLDTIRTHRGEWRASDIVTLRRLTGGPTKRSTARRDLAELHRRGHLNQHGPTDGRFYTLRRKRTRGGDER